MPKPPPTTADECAMRMLNMCGQIKSLRHAVALLQEVGAHLDYADALIGCDYREMLDKLTGEVTWASLNHQSALDNLLRLAKEQGWPIPEPAKGKSPDA